jgi:hypothetical protein
MFTPSDTRTTSQLLGNPAIRQLLDQAWRVDREQQKGLDKLDLRRQQSLFGGPYLWFNFVSRACSHSVAMLLVEYNRRAIPRRVLHRYSAAERERYHRWLRREEAHEGEPESIDEGAEPRYATTAFTALHFLDNDATRDAKVAEHFGEAVLDRLRADRRLMFRRIFGTYPMHNQPKERRVVNPYTFYQKYLARGRALVLPVFVLGMFGRAAGWLFQWIMRSVQEIRDPAKRINIMDAAQGDFRTAVRKINRVRLPVVLAALRLRMQIDPEYVGAAVPGEPASPDRPIQVEADRRFLDLDMTVIHEIDAQRRRARADMRRLRRLIDDGLLERAAERVGVDPSEFRDREHRRAAAVAYTSDDNGARSCLSAQAICKEVLPLAANEGFRPRLIHFQWRLRRVFNQWWQRFGENDRAAKQAAWAAAQQNHWGVADALRCWAAYGEEATAEGERRFGELLQHSERLGEQLASLRAVQTLSVLDVLHYRQHVFALGGYGEEEEPPDELLQWHTTVAEADAEADPQAYQAAAG